MILSVVELEVAQKFCDRIFANRARWQALTWPQPQPQPLVCSSIHAGTSHPNHVGRKRSPVRCCSSLCVRIVLNYEMISYLRRKSRLVRIRETAGWLQVRTEEEGGGNADFCPHMSPIPRGLKLERWNLPFQTSKMRRAPDWRADS